jgi:hypothetical protein
LTELKDVSFSRHESFACGHKFVIGQGKYIDEHTSNQSPFKHRRISPTKAKCSYFGSGMTHQDLSEIESLGNEEQSSFNPQLAYFKEDKSSLIHRAVDQQITYQ